MFFKVCSGIIGVLFVVIFFNINFQDNETSLIEEEAPKRVLDTAPDLKGSPPPTRGSCENYVMTTAGKICVASGLPGDYKKELIPSVNIEDDEKISGTINSYVSPADSVDNDPVYVQEVAEEVILKTEEQKIEPGTIFIPFFFKSCTFFCK